MNPRLPLQDIQGLDAISWWPLPMPAWIALFALIIVIILIIAVLMRLWRRPDRWQKMTLGQLKALQANLSSITALSTALQLSALLRRLAIHRLGREACASLEGDSWLKWLSANDRRHFDWASEAKFLIEAPFAPPTATIAVADVKRAIEAAKGWV